MAWTSTGANSSGEGQFWEIGCDLAFTITEPAEVVIQILAARTTNRIVTEQFSSTVDGHDSRAVSEISGPCGARMQIVHGEIGCLDISYRAELRGQTAGSTSSVLPDGCGDGSSTEYLSYERQVYLRPSRYCPSDLLVDHAKMKFGTGTDITGRVEEITEWIHSNVAYVPGSGTVHDSAEDTLNSAVGSCRDFAHLGVALCRATGVPARFVGVYAPGLSPMDFHAVYETFEWGRWYLHDATRLAPRSAFVRIATGRDAADVAFISITNGEATLDSIEVFANVDPVPPRDDPNAAYILA